MIYKNKIYNENDEYKNMTIEDRIIYEITKKSKLLREQEKRIQEFLEALEIGEQTFLYYKK